MNPPVIDTKPANGPQRRPGAGRNRRSPHPTHRRREQLGRDRCQGVFADNQRVHSRTMRALRAFVGLLIALLLISVAHAIKDGLTPGLALGLALTILLVVAALELGRIGSRRKPREPPRPRSER